MPTLGCSLIVRNAQDTLDLALESVRPHVDQLVVVDTGSTDATCEIAAHYADCLVGIRWPDSFAVARQHALDLLGTDWCMWLDADDELIDGHTLRPLIADAPDEQAMYLLRYETGRDENGAVTHEFWRERVFKRGLAHWVGRAHEVLVPDGSGHYERHEGAFVRHHGHGSATDSLRRNIRLLELDLDEKPEDTRTQFYLGRDLVTVGELDRGRDVLQRYLEAATWPDEAYIAGELVAYTYRKQERYTDAYMADLRLLGINALWPQGYFALAEDCYYLQKWDWCVHFSEIGESLPRPESNLFQAPQHLEAGWMIHRAVALYQLGRLPEAAELTVRALHLLPDDPHHLMNARFFAAELAKVQQDRLGEIAGVIGATVADPVG